MRAICEGRKTGRDVVQETIAQYRDVYIRTQRQLDKLHAVSALSTNTFITLLSPFCRLYRSMFSDEMAEFHISGRSEYPNKREPPKIVFRRTWTFIRPRARRSWISQRHQTAATTSSSAWKVREGPGGIVRESVSTRVSFADESDRRLCIRWFCRLLLEQTDCYFSE